MAILKFQVSNSCNLKLASQNVEFVPSNFELEVSLTVEQERKGSRLFLLMVIGNEHKHEEWKPQFWNYRLANCPKLRSSRSLGLRFCLGQDSLGKRVRSRSSILKQGCRSFGFAFPYPCKSSMDTLEIDEMAMEVYLLFSSRDAFVCTKYCKRFACYFGQNDSASRRDDDEKFHFE